MFKFSKKIILIIILFILFAFSIIIITNYFNLINKESKSNLSNTENSIINESQDLSNTPTNTTNIKISINYVFPDFIYNSKNELYNDFFSYLYQYVITNHSETATTHLNECGMYNLDDVLRICKEWDDNDGTGLPLVGKAFSPYFAYRKTGSNFVEQKDKNYFLGYCINNNRFVDFLYFLKTFFYHFRIDEGYTKVNSDGSLKNPEGSDYFASPYASIIDTAKFFIYTKETLPAYFYSKNNIPKLYDKIPGLLKEPYSKSDDIIFDMQLNQKTLLPNNFDCYGFVFSAWYQDADFKTKPIEYIDKDFINKNGSNITLYAKFERVGDFAEEIKKDFPNLK